MKIEKSPLEFINFFILKNNYSFNTCEPGINLIELFNSYEIDLDYQIQNPQDNNFQVFIKIKINNSKIPLPGYSIFAEGVAIYSIPDPPAITEIDRKNLISYSSVSIAINCLRDYISSASSFWPFGKYILPAVDLNKLINDKFELVQKQMKESVDGKKQKK